MISQKQNYRDSKIINSLQGFGGRGCKGRAQWSFRVGKLLCMKWWIHIIMYLFKPIKCTTPRVNLNVNYGV